MEKFHLGLPQNLHSSSPLMDTSTSPSVAAKSFRKNIITTLMEATTFKEDTYFVSNLKSSEKKALQELKDKLSTCEEANNASMFGVPLLGGNEYDDRANVLLLTFLRARDFKVVDALNMLLKCLTWRTEFGAENVVHEELVEFNDLEGVVAYMQGYDREGHPVCYNAYGVFREKEMFEKVFGDEEKLKKFLRWRVQVLERAKGASNHILSLFQDNYPEMVARKVIYL
ncbi:hypothetical protein Lal_00038382 [Lupinus albus]|nr:hypothetical protein Lal_00038382 [Lupinus albus]